MYPGRPVLSESTNEERGLPSAGLVPSPRVSGAYALLIVDDESPIARLELVGTLRRIDHERQVMLVIAVIKVVVVQAPPLMGGKKARKSIPRLARLLRRQVYGELCERPIRSLVEHSHGVRFATRSGIPAYSRVQ